MNTAARSVAIAATLGHGHHGRIWVDIEAYLFSHRFHVHGSVSRCFGGGSRFRPTPADRLRLPPAKPALPGTSTLFFRCVVHAAIMSSPKMRSLRLLCFLATMSASFAGIDDSLDVLKKKYGEFEANSYRPDIYPTSYVFKEKAVAITVTPFAQAAKKVDVFFEAAQAEPIEALLERYSGRPGWKKLPTSDPEFGRHFPLFSTEEGRNSYYATDSLRALVQRDVGFGKLVLWIQTSDYPELLAQYRRAKKKE